MPQNEPESPPKSSVRLYDKWFNLLYEGDDPDELFGLTIVADRPETGRLKGRVEAVAWTNSLLHDGL